MNNSKIVLAGKFCKYIIIVQIILYTFYYSCKVLFAVMLNKKPRKKIDQIERDWSKKILRTVKASYKINNRYGVILQPNHSYIIMSNHCSHFDIPLVSMIFQHGSVRMLAKKELFKVPVWGAAMKKGEFMAIDRENRKQAVIDLRLAKEKMQSGVVLWIAPEGTRSKDGELQAFKKGGFMLALKTGATIVPVNIEGSRKILPPDSLNFALGVHININVGRPINASQYDVKELKIFMEDVRSEILNSKF